MVHILQKKVPKYLFHEGMSGSVYGNCVVGVQVYN